MQGSSLFNKRRVKALGKVVLYHLSGAMADRWINNCRLIIVESKALAIRHWVDALPFGFVPTATGQKRGQDTNINVPLFDHQYDIS
ncbi:unnamed protein product [Leuciscus chuanchicus]